MCIGLPQNTPPAEAPAADAISTRIVLFTTCERDRLLNMLAYAVRNKEREERVNNVREASPMLVAWRTLLSDITHRTR